MNKLPQISHQRAVRALRKNGFWILRSGKHISMTNGKDIVIIPRQHILKPGTLNHILKSIDLSAEEFKKSL